MFENQRSSLLGLLVGATIIVSATVAAGQTHRRSHSTQPAGDQVYDFRISPAFLKSMADGGTIQPELTVSMKAHSPLHPLASDCEMHVAGEPESANLGDPSAIVVEPPNLCKFQPDQLGSSGGNAPQESDWSQFMDDNVAGKDCKTKGFLRVFTEHATSGGGASNPNHVFEIHPALSFDCGSGEFSFAKFLKYFPGMRAIKPASSASCLGRTLKVRYNEGFYEFVESKGTCGNFAIVEVTSLNKDWVRKVGGGHSAIARVSVDGSSTSTLKIYTLEGTEADNWLAQAMNDGLGSNQVYLHGMFTYDYFSIVKALRSAQGVWSRPSAWTDVDYPLALVIFGQVDPDNVPWSEGDQ